MTVVIGVVEKNGRIHMGGDLRGSSDEQMNQYTTPKVYKIDDFLFGFCGSFRVADVLQHCLLEMPKEKKEYEEIENYETLDDHLLQGYLNPKGFLVKDLIPAIRKALKEGKILAKDKKNGTPKLLSDLLIGYGNKLFMVQDDFSVLENDQGFEAIGAGNTAAIGYLNRIGGRVTSKSQEKIRAAIVGAIEAVSLNNSSVSKESIVLTLEADKHRQRIKQVLIEREKEKLEADKKRRVKPTKNEEKQASTLDNEDKGDTVLLSDRDEQTPGTVQVIGKTNGDVAPDASTPEVQESMQ